MPLKKSWVQSANSATTNFPLNNLPYGVFSTKGEDPRCGVAIGDMILDLAMLEDKGVISTGDDPVFDLPFWNEFMDLGQDAWARLRAKLTDLLAEGGSKALSGNAKLCAAALVKQASFPESADALFLQGVEALEEAVHALGDEIDGVDVLELVGMVDGALHGGPAPRLTA